jgi:hypothetical protein
MPDDFLTKPKWNELFDLVRLSGFNPKDFERTMGQGRWTGSVEAIPTIAYHDLKYQFSIAEHHQGRYIGGVLPTSGGLRYAIERSPGGERQFQVHGNLSWRDVLNWFQHWLSDVKTDLETPDLWTELAANRVTLTVPSPEENTPFTVQEQRQLQDQLDHILGAILSDLQLTADQGTTIRADMDYLKEAATRVGRRDWTEIAMGVIGGWVLSSALPPEKVSEIWAHYFVPIFQSISNLSQYLPHLSR